MQIAQPFHLRETLRWTTVASAEAVRAALALTIAVVGGHVCAAQTPARADVIVVSGKLAHHFFTNDLFRIDTLWMQVAPDTVFHRWLSQGINGPASIVLTASPEKFGDRPNLRILTGKLMHGTAPGESPIVHIIYLVDEQSGTTGAVTFETDDRATALKFEPYDDAVVSIVIELNPQA